MNGGGIDWMVSSDVSKAYRNHMKAEVRKEEPTGKGKNITSYWETKNRQNHLWDAEVYNVAAALVWGIFGE